MVLNRLSLGQFSSSTVLDGFMLTFVTSSKTEDTDFLGLGFLHLDFLHLDLLDGGGTGAGFCTTLDRCGLAAAEMETWGILDS